MCAFVVHVRRTSNPQSWTPETYQLTNSDPYQKKTFALCFLRLGKIASIFISKENLNRPSFLRCSAKRLCPVHATGYMNTSVKTTQSHHTILECVFLFLSSCPFFYFSTFSSRLQFQSNLFIFFTLSSFPLSLAPAVPLQISLSHKCIPPANAK